MRIALDATYSVGSNLTGIGVYSQRLMEGLASSYPDDNFLFCYRPKQFRRSLPPVFPNARRRLLQPPLPLFRADLFHGLNQRIDRRPARRVVSTFHDLFVITGEYSTTEFRARFTGQARRAAAASDLIIAVSAFTGEQIESLLGVPSSRIRVVPHGVDLNPGTPPSDEERCNNILFVGSLQTRKNIARLVEAFEQLPVDWTLTLAGATDGYGAASILERIRTSTAASRIEVKGRVTEGEMNLLYRQARIFAFPSLDEGFGIPVLEAMANGIPVVTADRSALPEVAGDAAMLVDPSDTEQIAGALQELAASRGKRLELVRRGLLHVQQFSWAETVDKTYAVYRELL